MTSLIIFSWKSTSVDISVPFLSEIWQLILANMSAYAPKATCQMALPKPGVR